MSGDHPHDVVASDRGRPGDENAGYGRQKPITGWRCTAPPGVTEWHPGIPGQVIVVCEHRATAMRHVGNALPRDYRHLVTNYRYEQIGPGPHVPPRQVEPCTRCGGDGVDNTSHLPCKRCAGGGDEPEGGG